MLYLTMPTHFIYGYNGVGNVFKIANEVDELEKKNFIHIL